MLNHDLAFEQEQREKRAINNRNTKTNYYSSVEHFLADYLNNETNPTQRKQLEEIYSQAEHHQNIAMAMGEYDYQRGLKPDRRLAANQWYRLGFNKAYWQSIFALYGIEPEKFNN
ncbi:MAG: hypothetical protein QNJ54_29200 [Prochloraceae cyanobacterium]|nr:hypothetical protein [Prochloraceae cyanobacterium]